MANIEIKYDGKWPCLCMGTLIVIIDDVTYNFGDYCLSSGGSVSFDSEWNEEITSGEWDVNTWPVNFPEHLKKEVLEEINNSIPQGCCGGCV